MDDDGTPFSSSTPSSLSLEHSSSSFDWSDGATETDGADDGLGSATVEPYQYEPEASESEALEEDSSEDDEHRLGNTAW